MTSIQRQFHGKAFPEEPYTRRVVLHGAHDNGFIDLCIDDTLTNLREILMLNDPDAVRGLICKGNGNRGAIVGYIQLPFLYNMFSLCFSLTQDTDKTFVLEMACERQGECDLYYYRRIRPQRTENDDDARSKEVVTAMTEHIKERLREPFDRMEKTILQCLNNLGGHLPENISTSLGLPPRI